MRRIGLSDLDMAARALVHAQPLDPQGFVSELLDDAHMADIARKRLGWVPRVCGTGSLYAQAEVLRPPFRSPNDPEYLSALAVVSEALIAWRTRLHQQQ